MIELKRIELWRGPLAEVIDEMKFRQFSWGDNDCGPLFVGRVVEALTGQNLYSRYVGRYNDAASGYRMMREEGFNDLSDLVASYLPEYEGGISEANVGDIAAIAVDTPFKHALGVVNGERILVLTQTGLGSVDLLDADRAFRVG